MTNPASTGESLMIEQAPNEKRITERLRKYWEEKKGKNPYPTESQINSSEIEDIWDDCFLIEYKNAKFRYSFLGASIIEAYGDNMEGEEIIEDLLYPETPDIRAMFQEVLNTKDAVYYDGAFINKNNMDIKFRKILLPLGTNDEINYIIGGMRWKAF